MLSKKLAMAAASAAIMLGAFAPMAFADVSVSNFGVAVINSTTGANSGYNTVSLDDESHLNGSNVTTGNAVASNTVGTMLNNNTVNVNNNTFNDGLGDVSVDNGGVVVVDVTTGANTGNNGVSLDGESHLNGSNVTTGNANAGSNVQTLVNVSSVTVSGNNVGE